MNWSIPSVIMLLLSVSAGLYPPGRFSGIRLTDFAILYTDTDIMMRSLLLRQQLTKTRCLLLRRQILLFRRPGRQDEDGVR